MQELKGKGGEVPKTYMWKKTYSIRKEGGGGVKQGAEKKSSLFSTFRRPLVHLAS
jgi:hypothetical protein